MSGKPSYIPDEIWDAAKALSCRFASDAEVLRLAKSLVRRQRGETEPATKRQDSLLARFDGT